MTRSIANKREYDTERLVGGLTGLFLLVGRWTPSQIQLGESDALWYAQLRTWTAVLIFCAAWLVPSRQFAIARSDTWSRAFQRGRHEFAFLGVVLLAYFAGSIAWTPDWSEASVKTAEMLLIIAVLIGLWRAMTYGNSWEIRHGFWVTCVALTAAMAMLGVVEKADGDRVAVLGGGPNVFGRNMATLALGCLYFKERWTGAIRQVSLIVLGSVAALLVILSGSRGALLSMLVAGAVWWLVGQKQIWSWKSIGLVVGGLAVCLILLLCTPFGATVAEIYEARIQVLTIENGYVSGRDDLFSHSLAVGMEHPLFGTGIDGFRMLNELDYPHNFFLELFAEGGLVALAPGVGLVVLVSLTAATHRRHVDMPTLATFVLMLTAAQFSGSMYDSRGVFVVGLLVFLPNNSVEVLAASKCTVGLQSPRGDMRGTSRLHRAA